MEQGCREDDKQEPYREDLIAMTVSIEVRQMMKALLCASVNVRRTVL